MELLKKLSLVLGSTLFGLGLCEGVVRVVVGPVAASNITAVPRSLRIRTTDIPGITYLLRPNGVAVHELGIDPRGYFDPGATLTYRINALGFRGPQTTLEKGPGTLRIVGLGDSFTFGSGVRDEDTFLSVFEEDLRRREPDQLHEVLNLGAMGYDTTAEVALLRVRGLALDPDLVLIFFHVNDAGGGGELRRFNESLVDRDPASWRRHSWLLDHVMTRVEHRDATSSLAQSYRDSFRDDSAGWARVRAALGDAKALSQDHGFRLGLILFPLLWDPLDAYPFADIHATVRDYAESLQIPVLDLAPAFAGADARELWVLPRNHHPNERAHAIAGKHLYRFVVERGLLFN